MNKRTNGWREGGKEEGKKKGRKKHETMFKKNDERTTNCNERTNKFMNIFNKINVNVISPMCAINISSTSVDSRRTLQSKFSPPGARPFCSITA